MEIKLLNKKIKISNFVVANVFLRLRGLMFRRKENSPIILFNLPRKQSLHSLFVSFPFLVLWLDQENKVLEYRVISSLKFDISSKSDFNKIIEIPINKSNYSLVKSIVGKTFKKKNLF